MIKELSELIKLAKEKTVRNIAVAAAEDEDVLIAVKSAVEEKIVTPILIGDASKILRIARNVNFKLGNTEVIDCNNNVDSARIAVEMVKQAELIYCYERTCQTSDLLRAVLISRLDYQQGDLLAILHFSVAILP